MVVVNATRCRTSERLTDQAGEILRLCIDKIHHHLKYGHYQAYISLKNTMLGGHGCALETTAAKLRAQIVPEESAGETGMESIFYWGDRLIESPRCGMLAWNLHELDHMVQFNEPSIVVGSCMHKT